eukprot:275769-Amphidinium_carterae.1
MDREREQPQVGQYIPDIYRLPESEGGDEVRNVYDLSEHTLQYLTHLPGDTLDDDTRIEQILVLEDDIQSIEDNEYDKKRRQEEIDYPEDTYWNRRHHEGHHEEMMEAYRWESARDRQQCRDERKQGRFRGTKAELEEMRNSLLAITVSGRRQRLRE